MLQTSNYSLVLSLQFLLLSYDLFVNSFSELLRMAPVVQLVLFMLAWSTSYSISSKGPSSSQLCTSPSASPFMSGSCGSVILLLLQTDSRETGRSSLLPGLVMAAQGVHTSPEVTASRHTDGGLSFLTDATLVVLWGGGWPCAQEAA
ncbi:transmembrane protein 138 isoform X2 [Prionailurus viverrinus]|uniref:transmembrane protein 138 isoform X2 n=1 Tax=Prionailurus viverrinus TaxID=61388 RepID=UPI001FF207D0|nr:transmembrane protein 138 isoform X2 [Prionailurus viverrinus]